ncbi:MAG: hypothetical protein KC586_03465 [Myxococcales bacterium]|nr:hypothetical protein [Myxococcales bacterium]
MARLLGSWLSLVLVVACGAEPAPEPASPEVSVGASSPAAEATATVPEAAPSEAEVGPSTVEAPALDATTRCGGSRPLGAEASLLNGRLHMRPVEGARVEPRPWNIMGAPEPDAAESRLYLDAGDDKIVVMVYELFARAGSDVEAQVAHDAERSFGGRLERAIPLGGGLRGYHVVPDTIDTSREAVFTYALYVISPDDTMQVLAFYVSPSLGRDGRDACLALALRSARTLRPGSRRLQLGGDFVLTAGSKNLHLTLPPNHTAFTQEGPDFWVHRVREVVDFGHEAAGAFVYFGGHPSRERLPGTPREMPLLGVPTAWTVAPEGTRAEALREVDREWFVHASADGPDASRMQTLVDAFGTATYR